MNGWGNTHWSFRDYFSPHGLRISLQREIEPTYFFLFFVVVETIGLFTLQENEFEKTLFVCGTAINILLEKTRKTMSVFGESAFFCVSCVYVPFAAALYGIAKKRGELFTGVLRASIYRGGFFRFRFFKTCFIVVAKQLPQCKQKWGFLLVVLMPLMCSVSLVVYFCLLYVENNTFHVMAMVRVDILFWKIFSFVTCMLRILSFLCVKIFMKYC